MSSYSKEITYGIKQYLENKDYEFSSEEGEDHAAFYYKYGINESKVDNYSFKVLIRRNYADLIGEMLPEVEEEKRAAVSEYIHRVNKDMTYGNFEFNPSNGQVRFKNSMCCIGMKPTQNMIDNLFQIAIVNIFRCEEPLLKLLAGELNVEEAVSESVN
jgi:hypothetical protein